MDERRLRKWRRSRYNAIWRRFYRGRICRGWRRNESLLPRENRRQRIRRIGQSFYALSVDERPGRFFRRAGLLPLESLNSCVADRTAFGAAFRFRGAVSAGALRDVKAGICKGGAVTGEVSLDNLASGRSGTRLDADDSARRWRTFESRARARASIIPPEGQRRKDA